MKNIIITWIQWSGKWTQSELILAKYKDQFSYFEAGNILRAMQSNDNAIWNYIWSVIDSWNYLPDEFMEKVFDLYLTSVPEKKVLLDWFPRKIKQMHFCIDKLKEYNKDFVVINLEVPEEEVMQRLLNRRVCKWCGKTFGLPEKDLTSCSKCGWELYKRKDETIEWINKRFESHKKYTLPVIEYFESLWIVKHINWNQSIEKVFEDISNILDENK